MRPKTVLLIIIICAATMAAQRLPQDGAAVTVYGVDAEIAEGAGRQWHEAPASRTIPTSHLPSGVYLINITTPTTTQTTKLTLN